MMADEPETIKIRRVTSADSDAVLELIEPYVRAKVILARTIKELDELISCGFVAEHEEGLIGFAAIEIYSPKLAELRSLVVRPDFQGRGVGRELVAACVAQAKEQQVQEVMAISSSEGFFRSCGFDFTLPGEKKAFFFSTRERS